MSKVDLDVLARALESIGFKVNVLEHRLSAIDRHNRTTTLTWNKGRLNVRGLNNRLCDETIGRVKRAYATTAVRVAARRAGFQVQQRGERQLVALRRRY
jgi:hypothetical protein